MPSRRTLYLYHRSTIVSVLVAILVQVETANENGHPVGMDKASAKKFVRCQVARLVAAGKEIEDAIEARADDGPIEVSEELIDRLERAARNETED